MNKSQLLLINNINLDVSNGSFINGTNHWNIGTGWTYDKSIYGCYIKHISGNTDSVYTEVVEPYYLEHSLSLNKLIVEVKLRDVSGGDVVVWIEDGNGIRYSGDTISSSGVHKVEIDIGNNKAKYIEFIPSVSFDGKLSAVDVYSKYNEILQLDMYSDDDFSLTMVVDDVNDIQNVSTSYMTTTLIPGTANNNRIFQYLFRVSILSDINMFIGKKLGAIIKIGDMFERTGILSLEDVIHNEDGTIEYEVQFYDDVATLSEKCGDKLIVNNDDVFDDIDFSEFDHTFDITSIRDSWINSGYSYGYYYPLIDCGNNTSEFDIKYFKPGIYIKQIWDKIFDKWGFTYSSEFLNSERFEKLIYWNNGLVPSNPEALEEQKFKVSIPGGGVSKTFNSSLDRIRVPLSEEIFDNGNTYDNVNYKWVVDAFRKYNLSAEILFNTKWLFLTGSASSSVISPVTVVLDLKRKRNNVTTTLTSRIIDIDVYTGTTQQSISLYYDGEKGSEFNVNDEVYLEMSVKTNYDIPGGKTKIIIEYDTACLFWNEPINDGLLHEGDIVKLEDVIGYKNIKQIDFLKDIVTMFNLVFEPDPDQQRNIIIEPYNEYHSSGTYLDWTDKVDTKDVVQIYPLSETQGRTFKFKYTEDKDYYNKLYQDKYKNTYGEKHAFHPLKYDDDIVYDIGFSPTPLTISDDGIPISGIYDVDDNGDIREEEFNPRILYIKNYYLNNLQIVKLTTTNSMYFFNGAFPNWNYVGLADHFDDPDDVGFSLNFEQPEEYYYPVSGVTEGALYNIYWRKKVLQLTDKNSKMVLAYLKLDDNDIHRFRFNTKIMIDGVYYRVNKIVDWNPLKTTQVELLSLADPPDYDSANFIPGWATSVVNKKPFDHIIDMVKHPTNYGIRYDDSNPIEELDREFYDLMINWVNYYAQTSNGVICGVGNNINNGQNIQVIGDYCTIGDGAENIVVFGSNNNLDPGLSSIFLIGDGENIPITGFTSGSTSGITYLYGWKNFATNMYVHDYVSTEHFQMRDGGTSGTSGGVDVTDYLMVSKTPDGWGEWRSLDIVMSGFTGGTSGSSGIDGDDGTSGTSGIDGDDGTSGTSGIDGDDGTSGTSGTSGKNGTSGTSGIDGDDGTSGTSGTSGKNGSSGTSGVDGDNGTSGTSGINGDDGTSGTSGIDGDDGTSGTSGIDGDDGTSGTSGIDGTSGISGDDGTSGTSGINGDDGTSGTSGIDGDDGTSGTSGTSGIDGDDGTSGISGTAGTSGQNGDHGTHGTSGTSGNKGDHGTSGTSGDDGTSGIDGTSGTSGDGTSGTSGKDGVGGSGVWNFNVSGQNYSYLTIDQEINSGTTLSFISEENLYITSGVTADGKGITFRERYPEIVVTNESEFIQAFSYINNTTGVVGGEVIVDGIIELTADRTLNHTNITVRGWSNETSKSVIVFHNGTNNYSIICEESPSVIYRDITFSGYTTGLSTPTECFIFSITTPTYEPSDTFYYNGNILFDNVHWYNVMVQGEIMPVISYTGTTINNGYYLLTFNNNSITQIGDSGFFNINFGINLDNFMLRVYGMNNSIHDISDRDQELDNRSFLLYGDEPTLIKVTTDDSVRVYDQSFNDVIYRNITEQPFIDTRLTGITSGDDYIIYSDTTDGILRKSNLDDTRKYINGNVYFLHNEISGIYETLSMAIPDKPSEYIQKSLSFAGKHLLWSGITEELGYYAIPSGKMEFHTMASVVGATDYTLIRQEVFTSGTTGGEVFHFSGETYNYLGGLGSWSVNEYINDYHITQPIPIYPDDRLLIKYYAYLPIFSSGNIVRLYIEDSGRTYNSYVITTFDNYLLGGSGTGGSGTSGVSGTSGTSGISPGDEIEWVRYIKDTATENINNATKQIIIWDAEDVTGTTFTHSTTTNAGRVYVNEDGLYEITSNINVVNTGTARITGEASLWINGVEEPETIVKNYSRGAAYGDINLLVQTTRSLKKNSYIEIRAGKDDADQVDSVDTTPSQCEIIVKKLNATVGSSGTSGNGTAGTSGIDGTFLGTSGTSGNNGTSGTSGTIGPSGTSGTSGKNGSSGTSGENGSSGTSGHNGDAGTAGTSGTSGNGTAGTSGVDGTGGGGSDTDWDEWNVQGINLLVPSGATDRVFVGNNTRSPNLSATTENFSIDGNVGIRNLDTDDPGGVVPVRDQYYGKMWVSNYDEKPYYVTKTNSRYYFPEREYEGYNEVWSLVGDNYDNWNTLYYLSGITILTGETEELGRYNYINFSGLHPNLSGCTNFISRLLRPGRPLRFRVSNSEFYYPNYNTYSGATDKIEQLYNDGCDIFWWYSLITDYGPDHDPNNGIWSVITNGNVWPTGYTEYQVEWGDLNRVIQKEIRLSGWNGYLTNISTYTPTTTLILDNIYGYQYHLQGMATMIEMGATIYSGKIDGDGMYWLQESTGGSLVRSHNDNLQVYSGGAQILWKTTADNNKYRLIDYGQRCEIEVTEVGDADGLTVFVTWVLW